MDTIKFEHKKQYGTGTGAIITTKALITISGEQFVECYENGVRYKVRELIEMIAN